MSNKDIWIASIIYSILLIVPYWLISFEYAVLNGLVLILVTLHEGKMDRKRLAEGEADE